MSSSSWAIWASHFITSDIIFGSAFVLEGDNIYAETLTSNYNIPGIISKINIRTKEINNNWLQHDDLKYGITGLDISNGYLYVAYQRFDNDPRAIHDRYISKFSISDPSGDNVIPWVNLTNVELSQKTNDDLSNRDVTTCIYGNDLYAGTSSCFWDNIQIRCVVSRFSLANPDTDYSFNWVSDVFGSSTSTTMDLTVYNGNIYATATNENLLQVKQISISNPPVITTMPDIFNHPSDRIMSGGVWVDDTLYYSSTYPSSIMKVNLTSSIIWKPDTGSKSRLLSDGEYIFGAMSHPILPDQIFRYNINAQIPSDLLYLDLGNTYTLSNGNLQVAIVDPSNNASNDVRYVFSITPVQTTATDGEFYGTPDYYDNYENYVDYGIITNGPSNTIFEIPYDYINTVSPYTLPISKEYNYGIYVRAINTAGVSASIYNDITVIPEQPKPPSAISECTVSVLNSGTINISITDQSPSSVLTSNDTILYLYYINPTSTFNAPTSIDSYVVGASMDPSYTTSFNISNQPADTYTIYLIAKNSTGNTIGSPFIASINVYTSPSSSISFDTENTTIISSGNLKVTVNDSANTANNMIYYYYSINNGVSYINTNIANNGPTTTSYTFFITYNPLAIETIYVMAKNHIGNSNTIGVNINSENNTSLYNYSNEYLQSDKTSYEFLITELQNKPYTIYLRSKNVLGYSSTTSTYDVTVYTSPTSTFSFDTENTKTVAPGNLQVQFIDPFNSEINGIYYQYSIDGINGNEYTNITTQRMGETDKYRFYINDLSNATYTINIIAKNTIGTSDIKTFSQTVYTLVNPPIIDPSNTLSETSNNLTVSFIDTTNTALNDVKYYYLLRDDSIDLYFIE